MKTDPTAITHHDGGTVMTGDAIELMRWLSIKQGLVMYNKTNMLITRGATPKKLLLLASGITKKVYRNNKEGREKAITDLEVGIQTLRAAIPDVDKRTKT